MFPLCIWWRGQADELPDMEQEIRCAGTTKEVTSAGANRNDFSDLLRIFNDHNVRYMVVRGYAVVQYAELRFTKDLDMLISTDAKNAEAVYSALLEFGAPLAGLTWKDFAIESHFHFKAGFDRFETRGRSSTRFDRCRFVVDRVTKGIGAAHARALGASINPFWSVAAA
jgi:hypothetical protein